MKKTWICTWEIVPGNGEQTARFTTLAAAKNAMRHVIAEHVDPAAYLRELGDGLGREDVAEFLGKYLSDPDFPRSAGQIPDDSDEPEHCALFLGPGCIGWDHRYGAYPRLHTNLVLEEVSGEDYEFHFWYEYPEECPEGTVTGVSIRIREHTDYGTSAYPLMVLKVLTAEPRTQDEIIDGVFSRYETRIDRKAVSRHLKLLTELGFNVHRNKDGYFIPEEG